MSPVSNMQPMTKTVRTTVFVRADGGGDVWCLESCFETGVGLRCSCNSQQQEDGRGSCESSPPPSCECDAPEAHARTLLKHRDPFSPAVDEGAPNVDEVLARLDDNIAVG